MSERTVYISRFIFFFFYFSFFFLYFLFSWFLIKEMQDFPSAMMFAFLALDFQLELAWVKRKQGL